MDAEHQATDLAVGARARLEPRRLIPVAGGSRPTPGPATGSGPTGPRAPPGPGPGHPAPSPPTARWSSGPRTRPAGSRSGGPDADPIVSTSKGHNRPLLPRPAAVGVMLWRLPRPTGRSWPRRAHWASTDGGEFARKVRRPGKASEAGGGPGGRPRLLNCLPELAPLALASDHLSDRKVEGSNPSSDSKAAGICLSGKTSIFRSNRRWQPQHLN
jgi:hypothetical protein